MAGKSDYAENATLTSLLGSGAYLALHTADPTDAGTTGELSGDGYARQAITFDTASGGATTSTDAQEFTATADWAEVTHFSLWDASTSGNCLYTGALDTARTVLDEGTLAFAIGDVDVTEG